MVGQTVYTIPQYAEDFRPHGTGVTFEGVPDVDCGLPLFPVEAYVQLPIMELPEEGDAYLLPLQQKVSHDTATESLSIPESSSSAGCQNSDKASKLQNSCSKSGRPVVDRSLTDEELRQLFK